jgi:regulator of sigma E protease
MPAVLEAVAFSVLFWIAVNATHVTSQLVMACILQVDVHLLSFGIGPTLLRWRWRRLPVRLALIPIAAVVTLRRKGPWPPEAVDPGDLRVRSRWTRLAVFSSPLVALAVTALMASFWVNGLAKEVTSDDPIVGTVLPDGPAARGGLLPDDVLITVGATAVRSFDDVRRAIQSSTNGSVTIAVRRNGALTQMDIVPDDSAGVKKIGITSKREMRPAPVGIDRLVASVVFLGETTTLLASGIISPFEPANETVVSGPVAIVSDLGFQGPDYGYRLITLITITQYFFFCLFLPFLDGVRLAFLGIEALLRRPIHPKYEGRFNWIWLAVLVLLTVAAISYDVIAMLAS